MKLRVVNKTRLPIDFPSIKPKPKSDNKKASRLNILLVADIDSACGSYELYKALSAKGHNVNQVAFRKNKLRCKCNIYKPSMSRLKHLCLEADVINIHHGPQPNRTYVPRKCLIGKPVIITYHGEQYRLKQRHWNNRDRRNNWLSTVVCIDLLRFCDNWLGRVMPDLSHMYNPNPNEFRVIHAPANAARKGTNAIVDALADVDGITLEVITGVTNKDCLKRKAKGHVFVDRLGVKRLGFATNALEAWSLGMPVITDASFPGLIGMIQEVSPGGHLPFMQAATGKELAQNVLRLKSDNNLRKHYIELGKKFIKCNHSPKAIAARFETFYKLARKLVR